MLAISEKFANKFAHKIAERMRLARQFQATARINSAFSKLIHQTKLSGGQRLLTQRANRLQLLAQLLL